MPDESTADAAAEWVNPAELEPWDDNPRLNQPIRSVAESIKRFGFASPIVARRSDGRIIAGHTRWKAAQSLGMDRIPVRFMDLDDDAAAALAIADNRIGELAQWDTDGLKDILNDLPTDALEGLGWGEDDLTSLMADPNAGAGFLDGVGDGSDDGGAPPTGQPAPGTTPPASGAGADGMVDFVCPMTVAERAGLHATVNLAKKIQGVTTTREAVLAIFAEYQITHEEA